MSKVGRYSHVAKENPIVIVGEQHRANQRSHRKLKSQRDKELEQLRSWRDTFGINVPILIYAPITLSVSAPVGSAVQAPRELAHALIRTRSATPVGDFSVQPVLVITEDDLLGAGDEPIQEPSMITVKLLTDVENMPAGTVLSVPESMGRDLIKYGVAIESSALATVFVTERDLA